MLKGAVSLEFMKFQNDNFKDLLAEKINIVRQADEITSKVMLESGLEELINKRFKTSIEFFIDSAPYANAYVELPQMDKNHPFFSEWANYSSNDMGRLVSNLETVVQRTGTVDIDKGQVSGIFSKVPVKMAITAGLIRGKRYTDYEVAAIILHEIGHLITYFYYMLNSTLGGFISAAVATAAMGAKNDRERSIIFAKGLRVMGLDDVAIDPLLHQTVDQNVDTLQVLYINDTVDKLRSLTGYGLYEMKCCEQLADAFAARFGLAVPLATALEKMHGPSLVKSRGAYYAMMGVEVAAHAFSGVSAPLQTVGIFIASLLLSDDKYGGGYDDFNHRIRYLRNHLIENIKTDNLPKDVVNQYVKDIERITKIAESKIQYKGLFTVLRSIILPWSRRRNKAVELQKSIEEMLYNESYVLAAKFQGASK